MGDKLTLSRETYKMIKNMDRERMQNFLADICARVEEETRGGVEVTLDMDKLRRELGEIKGIGENRLNEIMAVIEKNLNEGDLSAN